MESFIKASKKLLLRFLEEPWGLSFFPSSSLWSNNNLDTQDIYSKFFTSSLYSNPDPLTTNLLYIHIPFCSKICSYCNCFKYELKTRESIWTYLSYLELEAEMLFQSNNWNKIKIQGIFIWWWTPNILNISEIKHLHTILDNYFYIDNLDDFIIDWHPNYYSREKIDILKQIWVTRITFAIQTFSSEVLRKNNRDIYNIDRLRDYAQYAKYKGIKINIDLLIWLYWQDIDILKTDIKLLETLSYDNLSVHYFMNSNNIMYRDNDNYKELVWFAKNHFSDNWVNISYTNKFEDYFASSRNTTISLWASCVTNIFSSITYIKPDIDEYYSSLDKWEIPFKKWMMMDYREEMKKFIYLNILYWISVWYFQKLFNINIFKEFYNEFKFLQKLDIIRIEDWYISSCKSDMDTLIYFNIFYKEKLIWLSDFDINSKKLTEFFHSNWELIDK